jgi:hypothetical protein
MMEPLIYDSITHVPASALGKVVLAASHAGAYTAQCAARAAVAGVLLHDAGIGREQAGIAGLHTLDEWHIAAAALSHRSARIGDGADCLRRGVISFVNDTAARAGLRAGQHAIHALALLEAQSSPPAAPLIEATESRRVIAEQDGISLVALDSNSLVSRLDAHSIVLTGSHGGLLGGRAETAIKHRVLAAAYNDADIGIDEAGVGRLAALDTQGICAFTVSAWSARIGDGLSTYEDGFVTRVNEHARRLGAQPGLSARHVVTRLLEAGKWRRTI